MMMRIFVVLPAVLLATLCLGVPPGALAGNTDYYTIDDNAVYHFRKSQQWMEVEQYDAAIQECQIGIRLKPTSALTAALYNNMGLAYLKIGQFPKAIVSFQQAISLNPSFSLYYEHLVEAYTQSGGLASALNQLNGTTRSNAEDAQAWYLLGLAYKAQGDEASAKAAFETFLTLSPHSELADAAKLYVGRSQDSQTGLK